MCVCEYKIVCSIRKVVGCLFLEIASSKSNSNVIFFYHRPVDLFPRNVKSFIKISFFFFFFFFLFLFFELSFFYYYSYSYYIIFIIQSSVNLKFERSKQESLGPIFNYIPANLQFNNCITFLFFFRTIIALLLTRVNGQFSY